MMVTQEQKEKYQFQQTTAGKNIIEMLEYMKKQYCEKLGVPKNQIKTGKLIALKNGHTGKIDRFYEE